MRRHNSHSGTGKAFNREARRERTQRSQRGIRFIVVYLACVFFAGQVFAQVTFERLLNSGKEPQNWMTYSGDYSGRRFSALEQINTSNAHTLVAKWVYQTGA